MKYLFLFVIPLTMQTVAMAGFQEATKDTLYQYQKVKETKPLKKRSKRGKKNSNKELNALLANDKAIYDLLRKQEKNVIIRKRDNKVIALTRVKGLVLNSVLAMNVKPAKFIVRITDSHHDIENGELRCVGFSFEKRVPSKCDLLILDDEEFQVDVDIWDLDGAEGIIADYYYSGEEKTFLTSSFASFLGATFSVAKGGVNTPFGAVTQNTAKNKIMDGLLSVSENAKQKIMESGERNLTISYVNSGKEVLVFLNKSLNLNKEK